MANIAFIFFIIPAVIIIVLLALTVFEVMMFIDAYQNKNLSRDARLLWLAGMLLIHPLVAIAYYFLEYDKDL
jgi:hypothetical protein